MKDIRAFAEIRKYTGHDDFCVYDTGKHYKFGPPPRTALDFLMLAYVGGQGNN